MSIGLPTVLNFFTALVATCWLLLALIIHQQWSAPHKQTNVLAYSSRSASGAMSCGGAAAGLLISSVLLLKRNPSAQRLPEATAMAMVSLGLWVGSTDWALDVVKPAIREFLDTVLKDGTTLATIRRKLYSPRFTTAGFKMAPEYEVQISFFIHSAYPLVLLILLMRRQVREGFAPHGTFVIPDVQKGDNAPHRSDRFMRREDRYQ
jgi:hypothetical protein